MAFYTTQIYISNLDISSDGNPGWSFSNGWVYKDLQGYSSPDSNSSNQSVIVRGAKGIHIVIFGGGPTLYDWTLDGSPSTTTTASGMHLDDRNEIIFNSTLLSDSNHTVSFGNFTGNITLAYALIAPGPKTPVNVDTLYLEIDDTDPAITYTGNWLQTTNPSRHNSNTPGSTIESGFCGMTHFHSFCHRYSHASYYITFSGTFDPSLTGNITLGISIDNKPQIQQVYSSDEIAEAQVYYFWVTNLIKDPSNCQHFVQIELKSITGGQTFSFGSFYYQPSFILFGEAPVITVAPLSSLASATISSTSGIPTGSTSSQSHASNDTPGLSHSVVGPTVGAVGGLVVIGILLGIVLFLRKRQRDNDMQAPMEHPSLLSLATAPIDGPTMTQSPLSDDQNYFAAATTDANNQLSPVRPSWVDAPGGSPFYSRFYLKGRTTLTYVPPDQRQAGPSDDRQSRPQSTSETAVAPAPESYSSSGRPNNDNVTLSRQILEIMQSLQQRVDDMQPRPPAYEES